jgi:hypothetical protein
MKDLPAPTPIQDLMPNWSIHMYPDRYVAISVGASTREARLLQAVIGKPGLHLMLQTEKHVNEAKKVIEAYLNAPPVPGLRIVGLPSEWWCLQ